MADYLAHQQKTCVKKTYDATARALAIAAELFGPDKPLRQFDATAKKHLRDVLAKVPTNYEKIPEFKGMTARQAAEANKSHPVNAYKTQWKNLNFVGGVSELGA